ncbi:MAG TPA: SDR family oxidoreductase [Longimicrobiales bacterium]
MTLVVGSTGSLGTEVCTLLLARGHTVTAMVRPSSDPVKVARLRSLGADIIEGDLRDVISLRRACQGVDAVVVTATAVSSFTSENSFLSADLGVRDLIDAAKSARVQQFIFTSYSGNLNPDCDLNVAKRAVEQHLLESGLTYTVLRPSCFMEMWLSPATGFDAVRGRAQLIGSGDQAISYISLFDVARFAALAVGHIEAQNAILELGGPEAISPNEIVALCEDLSGRRFELSYIPLDVLRTQVATADNALAKTFAALMLEIGNGDVIPMTQMLRRFPQITLRSVRDFILQTIGVQASA